MILVLTLSALLILFCIAFQDFKERKVYWFLFPSLGLNLSVLYFSTVPVVEIFWLNILLNSLIISLVLLSIFLVTKILFKKPFLDYSFGLGDLLFFYAMALGFPTITFIVLFANALLFAFIVFLVLKKYQKIKTVPLAGLMSIFLFLVLSISIFIQEPSLYTY
ncbi:hypothetical protein [uncultured Croceitalea sp.]|uniref:hypothetical protein n=1 Tax=uncultured Croceitalea sp. TaxID=1798908 RepID=UPI00374F503C